MNYPQLVSAITAEIENCLHKTDEAQLDAAVELVAQANRVFLAGAGRSGLEVSSFAMRLTHIGLKVFRVGEVTTPAIKEGDLLVLASGSGKTASMLVLAQAARKAGAKVLLFTTSENSPIAELSDQIVVIHGKAAKDTASAAVSIQPMSNLFVQALCLTFDIIVIRMMERNHLDEALMKDNHANLE